jgi:hypothetical protein
MCDVCSYVPGAVYPLRATAMCTNCLKDIKRDTVSAEYLEDYCGVHRFLLVKPVTCTYCRKETKIVLINCTGRS